MSKLPTPLLETNAIENLQDSEVFVTQMFEHYVRQAEKFFLTLDISESRLRDTHVRWQSDMEQARMREFGGKNLDQYKIAGYLCYWLRRTMPVIAISEAPKMGRLEAGNDTLEELFEDQKFLYNFANEYLAFDSGFQICRGVDIWRVDRMRNRAIVPREEFLHDFCIVLKVKNVSPHALYLAYYALFDGTVHITSRQG